MIDSQDALDQFVKELQTAPWIAVDTEADSLHSYPEKLCLLQLSTPGRDALVDPLAGLNLEAFYGALRPHRLILHGADYDLRLLWRSAGFAPRAVFDTMLAARLLGRSHLGLEALAHDILGIQLEKGSQKANWSRRPLTERMLRYALDDSRHLKPIADQLEAELARRGRLDWHAESCDRVLQDAIRSRTDDPEDAWRLKGSSRLDRQALAVLRQLWRWREHEARRLARPPYFILAHETLLAVAVAAVRSRPFDPLLPPRLAPARRQAVHAAVTEGMALPAADWPPVLRVSSPRLSSAQKQRHDELRQHRDRQAARLALEPSVIASRAALVALAGGHPDGLMRWQLELLGLGAPPHRPRA